MHRSDSNIQRFRTISWFNRDGDKTLRLNYDLNEDSVVFDVGGYLGESTHNVFEKFKCNVYVFEPVQSFAKQIEERFKDNPKIKVFNIGLSDKNETHRISVSDDRSSLHRSVGEETEIVLRDISEFLDENKIESIDLMEVNIEGGEYPLCKRLIETGKIDIVKNLQVQFHDFVDDAENRMAGLRLELSKTHYPTFAYDFLWENWKKKETVESLDDAKELIDSLYEQILWEVNELSASRLETIDALYQIEDIKKETAEQIRNLNDTVEQLNSKLSHESNKYRNLLRTKTYRFGHIVLYPFRLLRKHIFTKQS